MERTPEMTQQSTDQFTCVSKLPEAKERTTRKDERGITLEADVRLVIIPVPHHSDRERGGKKPSKFIGLQEE